MLHCVHTDGLLLVLVLYYNVYTLMDYMQYYTTLCTDLRLYTQYSYTVYTVLYRVLYYTVSTVLIHRIDYRTVYTALYCVHTQVLCTILN